MASPMHTEFVHIPAGAAHVEGMLELPPDPVGVVLFAHGSGSSRFSPRNNAVAGALRNARIGTLLVDLLTPQEDQTYRTRFDIALLTQRLQLAAERLHTLPRTRALPIGLFGASTGAAAALRLAAAQGSEIAAVVSRGGRPDMAGLPALNKVAAPTLLIVGSLDTAVIELNQIAYAALHCAKRLEIVRGAGHLFEENGKLEAVSALAGDWFLRHMGAGESEGRPPRPPAAGRDEKRAH
ncbi:MAG TPA: alpha/beta hydrolase [Noviherbaspirillum sp.]|uniref:dienelactone hydrolase family protein n=1 Tax=Noviherbaspirillum sp. TaxID=1926288 RepID=UPI002D3CE6E1|nr:alpha/beta hydrolase [Noviherbaspirillum sp.]HYD94989.1 alpha/beta hydrolase [Noviherbaspirillum sp.]